MLRQNSYLGLREVEQYLMMTEPCGATNCTMMEVSCETVYFLMRQKLLHKMKEVCGATSRMSKDELIVGDHQVDRTRLLIYIYINLCIDV